MTTEAQRIYNREYMRKRRALIPKYIRSIVFCPNHSDRRVFCKGLCRTCYRRHSYQTNPHYRNAIKARERRRNPVRIAHKYGLTKEAYATLLLEPCAICQQPSECLDHNHSTNKVRKALCFHCNFGIGHFKERLELLIRAKEYLENYASFK